MSSGDRLSTAIKEGILPASYVRDVLGAFGVSLADSFLGANVTPAAESEKLTQEELRERLSETFSMAEGIYWKHLSVHVPSIERFRSNGFNITGLFEAYNQMVELNLEPEFVLAPELSKQQTNSLFKMLAHDSSIPNQRLALGLRDHGAQIPKCFDAFEISDDIWQALSSITFEPTSVIKWPQGDPHVWSLSVMPTCAAPDYLGYSYKRLEDELVLTPNLSQLIALHCQRIYAGTRMIDEEVPHGDAKNGYYSIASAGYDELIPIVPAVYFISRTGQLKVKLVSKAYAADNIGTRAVRFQG